MITLLYTPRSLKTPSLPWAVANNTLHILTYYSTKYCQRTRRVCDVSFPVYGYKWASWTAYKAGAFCFLNRNAIGLVNADQATQARLCRRSAARSRRFRSPRRWSGRSWCSLPAADRAAEHAASMGSRRSPPSISPWPAPPPRAVARGRGAAVRRARRRARAARPRWRRCRGDGRRCWCRAAPRRR